MKTLDIYKHLSWKIKFDTGDMPYPPVMFWKKKYSFSDVLTSWNWTIEYAKKQANNHNMWLYVHIPFCYTHCFFCTCVTKTEHRETEYENYLDLLEKECSLFAETFKDVKFNTVYVGGWTPTILTPVQIDRFYTILKKYFDLTEVFQIMTEGSPYTTTKEKLQILKQHWVNKMTFWVQSLDSKTLGSNNRVQQVHHVQNAVTNARDVGIEHINLDIMAWLPDQDFEWFTQTLKLIQDEIHPTTVHINAFRPTKNTIYHKQGRVYSREDIELRNKMRKEGHYLEEHKHKIHDSLLTHNVQLYNAKKFNSSILWIGYWAISHAFWQLHYGKDSFDEYSAWLHGGDILFKWYHLSVHDEIIGYIINNYRNGVYLDKFEDLFWAPLDSFPVYKKIKLLEQNNIVVFWENDLWKYFKISRNSDIFTSIYAKSLFDNEIVLEFADYMKAHPQEFIDLDLRLNQFFTD